MNPSRMVNSRARGWSARPAGVIRSGLPPPSGGGGEQKRPVVERPAGEGYRLWFAAVLGWGDTEAQVLACPVLHRLGGRACDVEVPEVIVPARPSTAQVFTLKSPLLRSTGAPEQSKKRTVSFLLCSGSCPRRNATNSCAVTSRRRSPRRACSTSSHSPSCPR